MSTKKKQKGPSKLTEAAMMTSIRSNSLGKTGGKNELTMNDTSGKEGLFLKAQKDQINNVGNDSEKVVGNDEMINVGNDRVTTIANNSDDSIGNNETRTIGNNQEESIATDQTLKVGSNRSKTVGVNDTHSVGIAKMLSTGVANNDMVGVMRGIETGVLRLDLTGVVQAKMAGMAHLKLVGLTDIYLTGLSEMHKTGLDFNVDAGNNINQTAGTDLMSEAGSNAGLKAGSMIVIEAPDITLKGAGGFIRIDSSGVTIDGKEVKINCGGGAPGVLGGGAGAGGAAGVGGAAGGGGAGGGAGAAGAGGLQSDFGQLLDSLGVPPEYTSVIDQLLTDPMGVSFSDLIKIAPSFDSLLKYIPEDVLPPKYRSMLSNVLRLGSTELGYGDDDYMDQRRDDAISSLINEVKDMGKDQIEAAAESMGVDVELLKELLDSMDAHKPKKKKGGGGSSTTGGAGSPAAKKATKRKKAKEPKQSENQGASLTPPAGPGATSGPPASDASGGLPTGDQGNPDSPFSSAPDIDWKNVNPKVTDAPPNDPTDHVPGLGDEYWEYEIPEGFEARIESRGSFQEYGAFGDTIEGSPENPEHLKGPVQSKDGPIKFRIGTKQRNFGKPPKIQIRPAR